MEIERKMSDFQKSMNVRKNQSILKLSFEERRTMYRRKKEEEKRKKKEEAEKKNQ